MRRTFLTMFLISTASFQLNGLEIPLVGTEAGGGKGGANIGYVDMDHIFRIFPQTLSAKEDYMKQLKRKRDQLAEKEKELEAVKSRMSVLENTLKDYSTAGAPAPADGSTPTPALQKELEEKQAEYEDIRKQAANDLATFESQQSQMILGKIYQALKELANEQQISVVVDKSSVLYGDATIDLTQKLQERVRGY